MVIAAQKYTIITTTANKNKIKFKIYVQKIIQKLFE
jgi:hypothetical protein